MTLHYGGQPKSTSKSDSESLSGPNAEPRQILYSLTLLQPIEPAP